MHKLALGIAIYGAQYPDWWSALLKLVATLPGLGIDFKGVLTASSMLTDSNRNLIVKSFLNETTADWLFWLDADNRLPDGGLKRLLDINKTMVSALYYAKREPHTPIAYGRAKDGMYIPISDPAIVKRWERGEVVPIDAAGMGCLLTHRSVYEDIQKNYVTARDGNGRTHSIHRGDINGKLPDEIPADKFAGQVYKGSLRLPLRNWDWKEKGVFPFFLFGGGRTEDMHFFETAYRVGHKCWLDTSVEADHISEKHYTGEDYRRLHEGDRYITEIPYQPLAERIEVLNALP